MNQNIEIALKQAFSLIEADQLEEAKALLRPILEAEKDNPDVWWVYSHAVKDVETARLALNNVLRIEPDYPGARDLFDQLESVEMAKEIEDFGVDPSFVPALPTTIPGISPLPSRERASFGGESASIDDEMPDDLLDDEQEDEAFYRRPLFYVPLISLLLIAALAIVIFKPFAVNSPTVPTAIGDATAQSLVLVTPTVEEINGSAPTLELLVPTNSATSIPEQPPLDFTSVTSALSQFTLPPNGGVTFEETALGKTLVASFCTTAGREMRALLPTAMNELAKVSGPFAEQSNAIAVSMVDCDTNSTLLKLGVPINDVTSFASGTLSEQEFQTKWKPLG